MQDTVLIVQRTCHESFTSEAAVRRRKIRLSIIRSHDNPVDRPVIILNTHLFYPECCGLTPIKKKGKKSALKIIP